MHTLSYTIEDLKRIHQVGPLSRTIPRTSRQSLSGAWTEDSRSLVCVPQGFCPGRAEPRFATDPIGSGSPHLYPLAVPLRGSQGALCSVHARDHYARSSLACLRFDALCLAMIPARYLLDMAVEAGDHVSLPLMQLNLTDISDLLTRSILWPHLDYSAADLCRDYAVHRTHLYTGEPNPWPVNVCRLAPGPLPSGWPHRKV